MIDTTEEVEMVNDVQEFANEAESAQTENSTETPSEGDLQQAAQVETEQNEKGSSERSKLDQASYSFRKQLAKNKQKYETRYNELQSQYNDLLARLDRLEHPEKYQPLNREQFDSDDDYIQKLVEERFNNVWQSKLEEAKKQYETENKQNEEINAYRSRADENVKKLFKTPEAEKQYRDTIAKALNDGLGELVDTDKEVAMYIMRSDLGPKILYEMATNPKVVEDMFGENVTEMDRQFKIRELENKLRTAMVTPPPPVIGKPGMNQAQPNRGSIFDSDDSILEYLRTH